MINITKEWDARLKLLYTFCIQTSLKLHRQLVHVIATYPGFVHTWSTIHHHVYFTQFPPIKKLLISVSNASTSDTWQCLRTSSQDVLSICGHLYSGGGRGHWEILDELDTLTQLCSSCGTEQARGYNHIKLVLLVTLLDISPQEILVSIYVDLILKTGRELHWYMRLSTLYPNSSKPGYSGARWGCDK